MEKKETLQNFLRSERAGEGSVAHLGKLKIIEIVNFWTSVSEILKDLMSPSNVTLIPK